MMIKATDIRPDQRVFDIIVIGAGGTGSHLVNKLAAVNETLIQLGYKGIHVTLFDDDRVSPTNVGRQEFSYRDIGKYKVHSLIEGINDIYGFQWVAYTERFRADLIRVDYDEGMVISCVDSVKSRREVFAAKRCKYWMDIGNGRNFGQIVFGEISNVIPKNRVPHLFDVFPEMESNLGEPESQGPSCSVYEALSKQSLFINAFMATYAANMVKDFLTNLYLPYNQIYFNLEEMNLSVV